MRDRSCRIEHILGLSTDRRLGRAEKANGSRLWMPDVMKIGGVTGWLQAAALAEAHGIRVSNHLFIEISTHLLSVTPTAHWLEYAEWFNPIIEHPLRIVNGCARRAVWFWNRMERTGDRAVSCGMMGALPLPEDDLTGPPDYRERDENARRTARRRDAARFITVPT